MTLTMPDKLWPIFRLNPWLIKLLYRWAVSAFLSFAKKRGIDIGLFCVVHTFDRQLNWNVDAKLDDGIDDEAKIRFPDRFPIFIDSAASQINIIKNAAYKSKVLKRNDTQLTLFKCDVETEHLALDMFDKISAVYPSAEIFRSLLSKTISISINGNDVLDKFDASEITMREYTGTQYRAKIVFDDERESEREKYGFLIVPHSVAIFNTVPQKRRNDAYKEEDRLHAPFIHYDLYKRM